MAACNCMLHRLTNVSMNHENFYKELNIIKQIVFNNVYNPTIIDSTLLIRQEMAALNLAYPSTSEKKNEYMFNVCCFIFHKVGIEFHISFNS